MTQSEVDLQPQLLDPFLHHERAVPRVVSVDLVRYAALFQPPHIVLDLTDGAARVVDTGRDIDRRPHLVDVCDG
jgi:hypothetical protein